MLTWRQASIWRDDETLNRHIIAHNPQARNAYRHLGKALYGQGRYEEALDAARVAVERRPNSFKAHVILGKTLFALGRFDEAETHLRRAIALNSKIYVTRLNLSSVLYNQGRYEEALDVARVAVERRPSIEAHVILGTTLNTLGRFKEAETHLRRAIALGPQTLDASHQLTELLFRMGEDAQDNRQPEAAAEYYIRALEIDPHYVEALHRASLTENGPTALR